jgi:hypothetical protein
MCVSAYLLFEFIYLLNNILYKQHFTLFAGKIKRYFMGTFMRGAVDSEVFMISRRNDKSGITVMRKPAHARGPHRFSLFVQLYQPML